MARRYTNMSTDRWLPGSKYPSLSLTAQWVDYVLATQSDISAVGVLALNVKRWATRAPEATPATIVSGIQELQAAGVLVYDAETEEVLRRHFVKDDGGYNNRKRRPVIERAARSVESATVRAALAEDFAEVGLPAEWLALPEAEDVAGVQAPAPHAGVDSHAVRDPDGEFPQVNSLSDGPGDGRYLGAPRSEGVVVTQGGVVRPQPSTPILPPSAAAPAATATALVRDQPLANSMPAAEALAPEATTNQRAFGLARTWIAEREAQGTPVVVAGRNGPLHALRGLIKPFLDVGYTDDEVLQEMRNLNVSLPAKGHLDNALARRRRREAAYRQGTLVGELERRGKFRDVRPTANFDSAPRESAQARKSRIWAEMREEADRMNLGEGESDTR